MGMKITGTAKITVGFASLIVCFALASIDFATEAADFGLSWSVSYLSIILKKLVRFGCTSFFFTLFASHTHVIFLSYLYENL